MMSVDPFLRRRLYQKDVDQTDTKVKRKKTKKARKMKVSSNPEKESTLHSLISSSSCSHKPPEKNMYVLPAIYEIGHTEPEGNAVEVSPELKQMKMPVQQISVVPAKDSVAKSSSRPKEKNEGQTKAPGRSRSRSSNTSKASHSTTSQAASKTSAAQDICSPCQLPSLEEDAPPTQDHIKNSKTAAPASAAQPGKKQVKRKHRRKRSVCAPPDCEPDTKPDQEVRSERSNSLSSERSEIAEKKERTSKSRRELPPRLRLVGGDVSDSSGDDACRAAHSWSEEKARRSGRGGSCKGADEITEVMELQSVGSDDGKENQSLATDEAANKEQNDKTESHASQKEDSRSQDGEKKIQRRSSRSSSTVGDGEELITKTYQERGADGGDMSVPTPQAQCVANGGLTRLSSYDSEMEVCRICHCEGDDVCLLITPCRCTGSLSFVHQGCLNQWIKSSDTRCCELCQFDFIMETKLKPLLKWEQLQMNTSERRKIFCSVMFHLFAIVCLLWSVFILFRRTNEELKLGKNGLLEWPYWTKLTLVTLSSAGGLIFMYIQGKMYLQMWHRLKAFNRIITVQNCPEENLPHPRARARNNMGNGTLEEEPQVSQSLAPSAAPECHTDSDMSVERALAPVQNPV